MQMAKNRGKKRLLAGLLICAALAFALMRAFANLNGALLSLAEARAEQRALQQISLALDEVMHKSLDYEDFVDVHYDAEGEASMLSANTILMNRIAADAATAAQEPPERSRPERRPRKEGALLTGCFTRIGWTCRACGGILYLSIYL